MGPPSGALHECQPGCSRVAYWCVSNPVHHAQARVGSTRGERDPLQLAEHSGDAAGVVPAIADLPGDTAPFLICACCNVCGGPDSHTAESYSKCGITKAG